MTPLVHTPRKSSASLARPAIEWAPGQSLQELEQTSDCPLSIAFHNLVGDRDFRDPRTTHPFFGLRKARRQEPVRHVNSAVRTIGSFSKIQERPNEQA